LSMRIFMNPSGPRLDENWQHLVEPGEEISIRATAFTDFHAIAVSILRRLVSATIFCATSRLRAMDPKSFNRLEIIKRTDVEAAAKTLGLEVNSHKFWVTSARRCNLEVHKSLSAALSGELPMTLEEVEKFLAQTKRSSRASSISSDVELTSDTLSDVSSKAGRVGSHGDEVAGELESRSEYDEEEESYEEESDDSVEESSSNPNIGQSLGSEYLNSLHSGPFDPSDSEFNNSKTRSNQLMRKLASRKALERMQDKYAEAIDLKAGLLEEQKLWGLLKQDPPFPINPEAIEVPKRPANYRKEGDDLVDWRDRIEFLSQWETFEKPIPQEAFPPPLSQRGRLQAVSSADGEEDVAQEGGCSIDDNGDDQMSNVSDEERVAEKSSTRGESSSEEDEAMDMSS